jgi:hypothetical protein
MTYDVKYERMYSFGSDRAHGQRHEYHQAALSCNSEQRDEEQIMQLGLLPQYRVSHVVRKVICTPFLSSFKARVDTESTNMQKLDMTATNQGHRRTTMAGFLPTVMEPSIRLMVWI